MKKLSLEKLKLAAEDVLQRSQMGIIYGGSGGCNYRSCHCTGSVGSWTGYYCSDQEVGDAVAAYCASGNGACTPN